MMMMMIEIDAIDSASIFLMLNIGPEICYYSIKDFRLRCDEKEIAFLDHFVPYLDDEIEFSFLTHFLSLSLS